MQTVQLSRARLFKYCALLGALPAGCSTRSTLLPPTNASAGVVQAPVPTLDSIQIAHFEASAVNAEAFTVGGRDLYTNQSVLIQLLRGTLINGSHSESIASIVPGDRVYARLERTKQDRFVATFVDVNIWVGLVTVTGSSGASMSFRLLDHRTLQPYQGMRSVDGLVMGHTAIMTPTSEVRLADGVRALGPGVLAKIFGFKKPASSTVSVLRAEVQRL